MAKIRGKDTKPEMLVRRTLWAAGYRYRVHAKDLPGRPDIAFRSRRKAVFVHGCFWHGHPGCPVAHLPKTRPEYWAEKFAKNAARDCANIEALGRLGYAVEVVWECEATSPQLAERLAEFLGPPQH